MSLSAPVVEPQLLQPQCQAELVINSAEPELPQATSGTSQRQAELQVFFSTFLTIFLAELGDKTQLTTLLMTAESHAPWTVFVGAGSALVVTSLIGVWLGYWLSKHVSSRTLDVAAGGLLLLIAAQLLWEVIYF
jgi:putative Ca2+/H+ antiporter (TMEM165/GDT1 family)